MTDSAWDDIGAEVVQDRKNTGLESLGANPDSIRSLAQYAGVADNADNLRTRTGYLTVTPADERLAMVRLAAGAYRRIEVLDSRKGNN